jgi:hypothetical protein
MRPRLGVIPCILCGLLYAATPLSAAPTLATNPALTFFSSLSEEPFARLEAASIAPRYTRHGPFRVPAPGVEIEAPTFTLHDQPCTPYDWQRVLRDLAAWRRLPGSADFLLTLPDGRILAFLRPPAVGEQHLSGLVRSLAAASETLLLRIAHDGDTRLRIDLRPAPKPQTRQAPDSPSAPPEPTDAPTTSPSPSPTAPALSTP